MGEDIEDEGEAGEEGEDASDAGEEADEREEGGEPPEVVGLPPADGAGVVSMKAVATDGRGVPGFIVVFPASTSFWLTFFILSTALL